MHHGEKKCTTLAAKNTEHNKLVTILTGFSYSTLWVFYLLYFKKKKSSLPYILRKPSPFSGKGDSMCSYLKSWKKSLRVVEETEPQCLVLTIKWEKKAKVRAETAQVCEAVLPPRQFTPTLPVNWKTLYPPGRSCHVSQASRCLKQGEAWSRLPRSQMRSPASTPASCPVASEFYTSASCQVLKRTKWNEILSPKKLKNAYLMWLF